MVSKIKYKEIRDLRAVAVLDQCGICPLCDEHLELKDAVLDHNHKTGRIRRAIHRFCNTFLGKIENGVIRNCITQQQLKHILSNYESYVSYESEYLHPSYKTPEERKERSRQRAKARRTTQKSKSPQKTTKKPPRAAP